MAIARRVNDAPQARQGTSSGAADFLTVSGEEAGESLKEGEPTERLLRAAMTSIPSMVMQKFHNRRGGEVPHRFYERQRRGPDRIVRLSPELRRIAASSQIAGLRDELDARWSIVETSFMADVGSSLIDHGLTVDPEYRTFTDKRRRRSVAGVREALIGFQHGRCLICNDVIGSEDRVAIDHVFPFALMERYNTLTSLPALDLDTVWNLAPAHYGCNADKSDRPPAPVELDRLARRNEAIMYSPHPLSRTLRITLDNGTRSYIGARAWVDFIRAVQSLFVL